MRYVENRFWSVVENAHVARLSIADAHGMEHFAIVPTGGKGWSERRNEALQAIAEHIEAGFYPGQVTV